jgi:hypothetical protein
MSGMVAAYNLARDGYSVLVREQEPGFGGSSIFNPSTHTTPLDPAATSEYIGIDISAAFHPVSSLSLYLHDLRIDAPAFMSYHVERSSRPQSLDALLYSKCLDAGVEFEFSAPLREEELRDLPEGTIVACGLNPAAYEYLDIPFEKWWAWMARGEGAEEREGYAWVWLDESINEYGYISFCNGIYYNLLFSYGREVGSKALGRYREFMRRTEGIEEEDWEYVHGVAPVLLPDNPALVRGGFIMCGTISGCIDPFMGFGISGALVSGKVAAMAVSDRERPSLPASPATSPGSTGSNTRSGTGCAPASTCSKTPPGSWGPIARSGYSPTGFATGERIPPFRASAP